MSSQLTKRRHNAGLLLLRVTVGGLMLFHGVHKVQNGIGWLPTALTERGLPEFLAPGIYLGEVVAPLLLIIGWFARASGLLIAVTMALAVYIKHPDAWMTIGRHGQWGIELQWMFGACAVAAALLGPGQWRIPTPKWPRAGSSPRS